MITQSRCAAALLVCFGSLGWSGCQSSPESLEQEPTFAVSQLLVEPNGIASFAAFASSLGPEGTVNAVASVPLPNSSVVTTGPTLASFLVSSGEAPEVYRYDIDEDGGVTQSGPVSFAGVGVVVQGLPPRVVQLSDSKAYYLDAQGLRGFVFDSSELVIVDSFSLEQLALPSAGVTTEIVLPSREIFRGDELLLAVIYRDLVEGSAEPLARILSINTITDEVSVIDDSRCGYITNVVDVDGDFYFASDSFNGAFMLSRPEVNQPSCILRLPSDASTFDPDYFVDLSEVTGSNGSGNLITGSDNQAYVLAYDEAAFPVSDATTFADLYAAPAWRTYRITLDDMAPEATLVDTLPLRSAASLPLVVDGISIDGITSADFSSTTLYRFDVDEPEPGLTFPGAYVGIVRLR